MARVGEHKRDDLFCNGIGVGTGCIHHIHVPATGIFSVDRIISRSCPYNNLKVRQCVNDRCRHVLAAHYQRVGILMFRRQIRDGCRFILHNLIRTPGLKRLAGNSLKLGWNEYLLHVFLLPGKVCSIVHPLL